MDMGNRGYQRAWVKAVIADAKGHGWEGVHIDSVDLTCFCDGTPREYPTERSYQKATESFIRFVYPRLHRAGLYVQMNVGNGGCPGELEEHEDRLQEVRPLHGRLLDAVVYDQRFLAAAGLPDPLHPEEAQVPVRAQPGQPSAPALRVGSDAAVEQRTLGGSGDRSATPRPDVTEPGCAASRAATRSSSTPPSGRRGFGSEETEAPCAKSCRPRRDLQPSTRAWISSGMSSPVNPSAHAQRRH
jgi:hypothetical protein